MLLWIINTEPDSNQELKTTRERERERARREGESPTNPSQPLMVGGQRTLISVKKINTAALHSLRRLEIPKILVKLNLYHILLTYITAFQKQS